MSAAQEPASVSATLNYFTSPADGSKPFSYQIIPPEGVPFTNWKPEPRQIEIENLRGKEDSVSLDKHGFQFGVADTKHKAFKDDEEIRREYYPETEKLLKKITGATKVVLFDHSA